MWLESLSRKRELRSGLILLKASFVVKSIGVLEHDEVMVVAKVFFQNFQVSQNGIELFRPDLTEETGPTALLGIRSFKLRKDL